MNLRGRKYIQTQQGWDDYVSELAKVNLDGYEYGVMVEFKTGVRTTKQNNAMHRYFSELGNALNDAGLDQRKVLKPSVDIPWSTTSVKKKLWGFIMKALTGKEKTSQLERDEVSEIYEALNRHIAEKFGVQVPFPDRNEPPHTTERG